MDDKTFKQSGDGDEQGRPEADGPLQMNSGSVPRSILLGGAGVLSAIVGVLLALYVIQPVLFGNNAEVDQSIQSGESQPSLLDQLIGDNSEETVSEGPVYIVDDIVVNPAGTGGTRFLSASFGFELESEDQIERFELREPIIRDALIMILSSKTIDQLTDETQKEAIRAEILVRVTAIINPPETDNGNLAGVYYTDFVLQ